jgi:predicted nucleic acid-binding protein
MPFMNEPAKWIFYDAGLFIGALLSGDPRHAEARPIVEAARRGELAACTSVGVLSEVYIATLTPNATLGQRLRIRSTASPAQ